MNKPPNKRLRIFFIVPTKKGTKKIEKKNRTGRNRESNPGLLHPKQEFYHLTISPDGSSTFDEINLSLAHFEAVSWGFLISCFFFLKRKEM